MKDRQANQDLWHLTIDDLFKTPVETTRLVSDGPFVINLSTSTAPISIPPRDQLNVEGAHAYQISRNEDGRQRFRLRLGPISTELEADAILAAVRERYPGAMIATPADDDLKAIASAARVAKATKHKPALSPTQSPAQTPAQRPVQSAVHKAAQAVGLPLPPQPETPKHDDSTEITGSGWEIDSLLPHLAGSAPAPRAKKPAPKAPPQVKAAPPAQAKAKPAPIAKPAAPQVPAAAKTAPTPPLAKSPPPPNRPAAAPIAKTPPSKPASPPPALATPAVPVAKAKPVPIPPVLTKPIAPPKPRPAAAQPPRAQPVTAQQAEPPAVTERVPPVVADVAPPLVLEAAPPVVAEVAPPVVVEVAPPVAVEVAPPVAVEVAPPVAVEVAPPAIIEVAPPAAAKTSPPAVPQVAPTAVDAIAPAPAVRVAAPSDEPILETDWTAILSAPIDDTAKRPAVQPVVESKPAPSGDDSGLRRLVAKSNAIVEQMDTRAQSAMQGPVPPPATLPSPAPIAVNPPPMPARAPAAQLPAADPGPAAPIAPVSESPADATAYAASAPQVPIEVVLPAAGFSPLSTQSIEQKLAKLDEILHGGQPAATEQATPPPAKDATADPAPQVADAAATSSAAQEVDVDIFIDDDSEPHATAERRPWFQLERRQEPRPTLKSPTQVLSSIDEVVLIDEANNLDNILAKQSAPATLAAPVEEVVVDLTPEPQAPLPAPKLALEADLALEPELTLASSDPPPAPVLIEDLVVSKADTSLEILVDKSNALVDSLEMKSQELTRADTPTPAAPTAQPAPTELAKPPAPGANVLAKPVESKPDLPPAMAVASPSALPATQNATPSTEPVAADPAEEVSVVSTVVLENPAALAAAGAEVPHVATVVLEPKPAAAAGTAAPGPDGETVKPSPAVIRSRESAADAAAKNAQAMTHRAAARAAKKLRAAKHAAKQAALAAAKSIAVLPPKSGSTAKVSAPAPKVEEPRAQITASFRKIEEPAQKPAGSTPKGPATSVRKPDKASGAPGKPHATQPKPAPSPGKAARPPIASKPVTTPRARESLNGAQPAAHKVTIRTEHSPNVDSTQTMRALTPLELADDQASKWFVIQLALSQDDFDPDHIPHLDIFEAYRLYSVIGLDQGKILHALRLGFFSDEISAQAVTGYIKTHFESASVKRVSVAERERFAERQVAARKDIGATGLHTIIEMASPTPVPETRLADLRASTGQDQPEEKSLWSRLVSPLKRS